MSCVLKNFIVLVDTFEVMPFPWNDTAVEHEGERSACMLITQLPLEVGRNDYHSLLYKLKF